LELQKLTAETGIVTTLVQLLKSGTAPTKQLATLSLTQHCLDTPSDGLQEKFLNALERLFWLFKFKHKYGASTHMPLVDLTQRGNGSIKHSAT
jgi:hypothetical protein